MITSAQEREALHPVVHGAVGHVGHVVHVHVHLHHEAILQIHDSLSTHQTGEDKLACSPEVA